MKIVKTKLFVGGVASGKTTECIEQAAKSLKEGKTVLFINDEERTEHLFGRVGERLFTLNTYAMKKIPAIELTITSYTNETYFSQHRFDVVIVDCVKRVDTKFLRSLAMKEYYETRQSNKLFFDEVKYLNGK